MKIGNLDGEIGVIEEEKEMDNVPFLQEKSKDLREEVTTNPVRICFNLINSTMGAGFLCLPYAFQSSGVALGCALFILSALLGGHSLYVLLWLAEHGIQSYQKMGILVFKKKFVGNFYESFVIFLAFGALSGYSVIIGEYVSSLVQIFVIIDDNSAWFVPILASEQFCSFVLLTLIVFPLSLFKKLTFLAYLSFLSFLTTLFVIMLIVIRFFELGMRPVDNLEVFATSFWYVCRSFPLYVLSYTNQVPFINLLKELGTKDTRRSCPKSKCKTGVIDLAVKNSRWQLIYVIFLTTTFVTVCYFLASGFGYFLFGDRVKDNILMNFETSNITAQVGKALVSLVVCICFPIYSFALRDAIITIFYSSCKENTKVKEEDGESENGGKPKKWDKVKFSIRHIFLSFLAVYLPFLVGALVPIVSVVFGYTAAIGSTALNFVFPYVTAIIYDTRLWSRILNIFVLLLTISMGILGGIGITMEYIESF